MILPNTEPLKAFFNGLTPKAKKIFAESCNTSVGYINQVMYGNSKASASLAIDIDRESGGQVPCESLCPGTDFEYLKRKAALELNVVETQKENHVQVVAS